MGDVTRVKIGACNVYFGQDGLGVDLGFTKGNVKVKYTQSTTERMVDYATAPIDLIVTKQDFEVDVPMAEFNAQIFFNLFPDTLFNSDGSNGDAIEMYGTASTGLAQYADRLTIVPDEADYESWLTLWHAAPLPNISYSYQKNDVRIYNVKFKALYGADGRWIKWGNQWA